MSGAAGQPGCAAPLTGRPQDAQGRLTMMAVDLMRQRRTLGVALGVLLSVGAACIAIQGCV